MVDPSLLGDQTALDMAAPLAAGLGLGRLIPPGPVLELCCGVGGLTRGLAREHQVLAVDLRPDRLAVARANLAALGLGRRVAWLCCDLERPALATLPPTPFAACVADPDWSPEGAPPSQWTADLGAMRPPVPALIAWARAFSPRLALRLPPGWDCPRLAADLPCRRLALERQGRISFVFLLLGDWPGDPELLDI